MEQTAQVSPSTTSQWEQEWERVLWKKKPYPDNYVPRMRFLEFLKTNGAVGPFGGLKGA
jgi:phosphatidylinositol glycan class C protein